MALAAAMEIHITDPVTFSLRSLPRLRTLSIQSSPRGFAVTFLKTFFETHGGKLHHLSLDVESFRLPVLQYCLVLSCLTTNLYKKVLSLAHKCKRTTSASAAAIYFSCSHFSSIALQTLRAFFLRILNPDGLLRSKRNCRVRRRKITEHSSEDLRFRILFGGPKSDRLAPASGSSTTLRKYLSSSQMTCEMPTMYFRKIR
jgi:hypothetical protein